MPLNLVHMHVYTVSSNAAVIAVYATESEKTCSVLNYSFYIFVFLRLCKLKYNIIGAHKYHSTTNTYTGI